MNDMKNLPFPSPCGVCDLKLSTTFLRVVDFFCEFPSPCGVCDLKQSGSAAISSPSLKFPSPCGVCDLKLQVCRNRTTADRRFPSPCGVCDLKLSESPSENISYSIVSVPLRGL